MKGNKKGFALSLTFTAKLILSILGFLLLFSIFGNLLSVLIGSPDQNIATLDIMVGEIEQGIKIMNLEKSNTYEIVFPLSLQKDYKIKAFVADDKSSTLLHLIDHTEESWIVVEKERIKDVALIFTVPSEADNYFTTSATTLRNYKLTIDKSDKLYSAEIEYCDDGWCQKKTSTRNENVFDDSIDYRRNDSVTWEWSAVGDSNWNPTSLTRSGSTYLRGEDERIVALLEDVKSHFKENLRTSDLEGATPLYFENRESDGIFWSPDKINWMPTSTVTVSGGKWSGQKPVSENQDIIDFVNQFNSLEADGVIEYDAGFGISEIYFKKTRSGRLFWSADKIYWMPLTLSIIEGGDYNGMQPASENLRLINLLNSLYAQSELATFIYQGSFGTPIYFRSADGANWEWSPDQLNWMRTNTIQITGGEWDGKTPLKENQQVIRLFELDYD